MPAHTHELDDGKESGQKSEAATPCDSRGHLNAEDQFFRDTRGLAIIKPEDERALIEKAQSGDIEARNELILGNIHLIRAAVNPFSRRLPLLDLINEGVIEFISVLRYFQFDKAALGGFARKLIRQRLNRVCAEKATIVSLTEEIHTGIHDLETAENELYGAKLGKEPTVQQLAERLSCDPESIEILRMYRILLQIVSLDKPLSDEADNCFEAITPDENESRGDETAMVEDRISFIRRMLKETTILNAREKEILTRRFGLDDSPPQLFEEIGKHFGISSERVRQLEQAALRKLRAEIRSKPFSEYFEL